MFRHHLSYLDLEQSSNAVPVWQLKLQSSDMTFPYSLTQQRSAFLFDIICEGFTVTTAYPTHKRIT